MCRTDVINQIANKDKKEHSMMFAFHYFVLVSICCLSFFLTEETFFSNLFDLFPDEGVKDTLLSSEKTMERLMCTSTVCLLFSILASSLKQEKKTSIDTRCIVNF
jgi:hypothetical protein